MTDKFDKDTYRTPRYVFNWLNKVPVNLPFNHKIFLKHRNAVKGVKKIYVLRRKNEIVVKFILSKVFFDGEPS